MQPEHLERGLPDPTNDELLRLLCKGIKRSQGDTSRLRLPITNILKTKLRIDLLRFVREEVALVCIHTSLLWVP